MFFPFLRIDEIVQIRTGGQLCSSEEQFTLLASLADGQTLVCDGKEENCSLYAAALLTPGLCVRIPQKGECSFVAIRFHLSDQDFARTLMRIPRFPQVHTLTVRACLLNIINAYSLQPILYQDTIAYNLLALLYHAHLAAQTPSRGGSPFHGSVFTPSPNDLVNQALNYIEEHLSQEISVATLGLALHQTDKQIVEIFRYEYGCTLLQFVNRFRLFRAKELLCYTNYSITEIAQMTGFKSIHYFSRYFKEKENMSPIEYKRAVIQLSLQLPQQTGQ